MRYFERKRRSLFKSHYVNGREKSVSGVGSIEIKSSAGVPFKSFEISGLSVLLPETDILPPYLSYFKEIENYEFGGVSSVYEIPFPAEWQGKELTFSIVEKTKMRDITFGLSDGGGFFANSVNLLGYNGEISTVKSSEFSHFRFTGITDNDTFSEITNFWQNYEVKVTKDAEGESPTPSEPWTIKCLGDEGVTVTLEEKTVKIPKSVTLNGTNIPLLLSEYDKLTVDNANKRVIYSMGSYKKAFTGTESFSRHTWSYNNGYGNHYMMNVPYLVNTTTKVPNGYCTQFNVRGWSLPQKNYSVAITETTALLFTTDSVQTVDEFKAFLKAQSNAGTPVTTLFQRKTAIEYDLTSTDFGKELLSLCLPANETAPFTVSGALYGVPVSAVYYSTKEADVVNITVKYVDENGNEIKEPWVNQTRRGSKYLVIAPHVDGYARVTNEIYGVADGDTEVVLEYRR